jgi:aspartate aminotransferase, cytoplasmic
MNFGYLPIIGDQHFLSCVKDLLFPPEVEAVGIQTLGGTGANHLAAVLLSKVVNRVWIPEQTWANHYQIWSCLPVPQSTYPYFLASTHGIACEELLASLETADEGDAVILHASCHNPTGVDPTREQWIELCNFLIRKRLIPLFDAA